MQKMVVSAIRLPQLAVLQSAIRNPQSRALPSAIGSSRPLALAQIAFSLPLAHGFIPSSAPASSRRSVSCYRAVDVMVMALGSAATAVERQLVAE